jgi:hypothetical protein
MDVAYFAHGRGLLQGMDAYRVGQIWGLLAAEADRRGQPISIGMACHTAMRVLSVDGAAVAAVGMGHLQISVFATSELGRRLEDLESSLGQGPGLQAYSDGAPVLTSDLESRGARWPLFASGAVEIGVRGLFAFPLRSGTTPIGVLETYRADAGGLSTEQLGDALVLAEIISLLLLGSEGQIGDDFVRDVISSDRHTEVYQATGMVSVQLGVSLVDALARLRGHAFAHSQPISVVAHEIVNRRLRLDQGDTDD